METGGELKVILGLVVILGALFVGYFLFKIVVENILLFIFGAVVLSGFVIVGFIAYKIYSAKNKESNKYYSVLVLVLMCSMAFYSTPYTHAEVIEPTARITQADLVTTEQNIKSEINVLKEEIRILRETEQQKENTPEENESNLNLIAPIIAMQIISFAGTILYLRMVK